MKTVLVTGSNGFIGKHLIVRLTDNNYHVIGISNTKQKSMKGFVVLQENICNIKSSIPRKVHTIVHLAALSDVEYCQKNPLICFKNNVQGTANMLETARKKDSNFIFMSTSHVYGKPQELPIRENAQLISNSIYSSSKILGENLCEIYAKQYGLNITILRLFSVYGPKSPKHNVIYRIISQLRNNSSIRLGNTKPKRDFIFIDDVIEALSKIINSQRKFFNVYNVSGGQSISIQEICHKLVRISKKEVKIQKSAEFIRANEVREMRGDYSKIREHYKWKPVTTIDDGLEKTYSYYVKN